MILAIKRIRTVQDFSAIKNALSPLIKLFSRQISDDFSAQNTGTMLQNLKSSLPYLWLSQDSQGQCLSAASLDDIIAGRHAYLHGISHPKIRRHPIIALTALSAIQTAFHELKVMKVKAEFPATNLGAKGFCLRFGFKKEAHFKNDNRRDGKPQDSLVYSLFAQDYEKTIRRKINHVLWQEKKQNPKNKNQRSPSNTTV